MEILYPRLRQMYEWFIGRGHGSNTRGPAEDGLISTYEYFYNLGWDDYPGHTFARMVSDQGWPAPVCQSVHTLIGARALSQAARELGLKKDIAVYEADARRLEQAILEHSWDGGSGYYGYVVYDHENGEPLGIIRGRRKTPSNERPHRDRANLEAYVGGTRGLNINMGLDGMAPWYAGIGSPGQREQQFELLTTEGRLWTSIGLLTVDLESPFSCPGYWIDRAWIPPQWWFWKGALDQGKADFAYNLAHAVLKNARHVAEEKWNTYENFSYSEMEAGGSGLNFAGLATPSLDFFHSYYVPGTISFGHDAWVEETEWSEDKTSVRSMVRFEQDRPGEIRLVLACFDPGGETAATWKGKEVPVEQVTDGAVYVRLPCRKETGELIVKRKKGK
jgi:glycogen debranching enzyme